MSRISKKKIDSKITETEVRENTMIIIKGKNLKGVEKNAIIEIIIMKVRTIDKMIIIVDESSYLIFIDFMNEK